jgi:hypothetical protein
MDGRAVICPVFRELLSIDTGQEVHNFSQKAVGKDPPLAQFLPMDCNLAMIGDSDRHMTYGNTTET